jgi:cytochrome c-type biogenesis protein
LNIALNIADLVLSGPLLIALPIAVAAGAISFFSPCCLPLVPGYLSYVAGTTGAAINHQDTHRDSRQHPRGRTIVGSTLFVAGFAAVFTSYGALFGGAGAWLTTHQDTLIRLLGLVTILLGLTFAGALARLPFTARSIRLTYRPHTGVVGAPLVGAMFGIGWTPCIGPTLAAVLTLSMSTASAGRGALLALAYALGLGIPFIAAATAFGRAMHAFGFFRRHARAVMRTGGLLLIGLGLLQVTGAWTTLITRMQGLITGWQTPL